MKRTFTFLFFFCCCFSFTHAQDSIRARVIFIGDAGEMDPEQKAIIPDAAGRVLPGKTTAMYLGDNIYPHGMGLQGSPEEKETQQIMRSQYEPLRAAGAPVYFIPGNHDWDRMGPKGLEKIKRQWQFLEDQNDSLLHLVPANGCPDPVVINVSDSLVIVAMDSEWWLFPFKKDNPDADCNCNTSREVLTSLQEILYKNRYKVILLATHHPFQSYGTHGGYFSWKDHLFPLTVIKHNLYIPLPVIGSLYPLYRKSFTHPEDLRHPLYKDMVKNVDGVFEEFPNLIHVSGHEHGLQLIHNPKTKQLQVVSGGGAKQNYTIKGKNSLFGVESQGYVVADFLEGNNVRFTYYVYSEGQVKEAYRYNWSYQAYHALEQANFKSIPGDSTIGTAHPAYDHGGKFYRFIFGENYRKEWAAKVKLPVLRVSELEGGLVPDKLGGGFQSTSLRLKDKEGREFSLRTVEKKPDLVVPVPFQGTFVRELLDDATSAQHPYSALTIAPVAEAVGVPHATPVIGMAAPDKNLGMYQKLFEDKVVLLEQREPLGESDNFIKMQKNLQQDNDNSYDAHNFLKARLIDLLYADWDRHGDQWRFYNKHKKGEDKYYIGIPRDRDMALNITQGLLPTLIKKMFLMPRVPGFKENIMPGSNYYFYKSAFLNAHPASQIGYADYMATANEFKDKVTDAVLEKSLEGMPKEIYEMRHDKLLHQLKARRDKIPEAADKYFRFSNKVVDIHTSNKNELVMIGDADGAKGLQVTIRKINKDGELKDTLMSKVYPDSVTKEIRIYIAKGEDSVSVHNEKSRIKLRLIGGKGRKAYNITDSRKKISLYDREEASYYGNTSRLKKHLWDDSLQTAFVPVNLYNTTLPLVTAAINPDDGIFLGAGIRYMRQEGFRKAPYSSLHQLMVAHSFSTEAFNIRYSGAWLHVFGKADLTANANIKAPDNTQNFFGRGNESEFNKTGNFKRYYRTRFNLVQFQMALRWRGEKGSAFSIGPAVQFYRMPTDDNEGRFILSATDRIGTYDSATLGKDKVHLGLVAHYTLDQRNSEVLPTWGSYVHIQMEGFAGANGDSKAFARIMPEVALYKSLNARQTVVLANRISGGATIGKSTFYQSMFLGGQGNLLGYRQYRFAGQHSLCNNLELRIALSDFGNYVIKGQLGISAFYDIGRVWVKGEESGKWHNGTGAGVYFAPAALAVFRFTMAYSEEGWYPNFSMGFRF